MSEFLMFFYNNMDWSTGDEVLKLANNIQLKLVWSNIYAPLDDFILTSPQSGQWFVIPDVDTKNELAVAIGNSTTDSEKKVAFFVDLIVKYELEQREAISIIHVAD
jgi:hypothetical protein